MADGKPTLHYLQDSQAQLVLWVLEELGIEYNLVLHKRVDSRSPPELKAVHPLGRSPTLITPSGRTITERSAITLWLLNTYDKEGRFRTPTTNSNSESNGSRGEKTEDEDVVREEQLISLGGATLGPLLMLKLIFEILVLRAPFFLRPLVAAVRYAVNKAFLDVDLAQVIEYLDSELKSPDKDGKDGGSRKWYLGTEEPTRADFSTVWYIDWANQWGWVDLDKYPRLKEFHARCLDRPAWKRALEKGDGYNLKFW